MSSIQVNNGCECWNTHTPRPLWTINLRDYGIIHFWRGWSERVRENRPSGQWSKWPVIGRSKKFIGGSSSSADPSPQTVLPHLANFRISCKLEGLFATQKRSFATCEFLSNFDFFCLANPLKQSKMCLKRQKMTWETAYVVKIFFANFHFAPVAAALSPKIQNGVKVKDIHSHYLLNRIDFGASAGKIQWAQSSSSSFQGSEVRLWGHFPKKDWPTNRGTQTVEQKEDSVADAESLYVCNSRYIGGRGGGGEGGGFP